MAISADVTQLSRLFAQTDIRVPFIVFKLLHEYADGEPISLDGDKVFELLANEGPGVRTNPQEAAVVHEQLERFFEKGEAGWVPRSTLFSQC